MVASSRSRLGAAYKAVQKPVEGTILTVLREAAEAAKAEGTGAGEDVAALLRTVYDRAVVALEHTPELLPVLKQAGVVDAGGAGFLLLLAAFLEVVTGADVELPERVLRAQPDLAAIEQTVDGDIADLRYEVMFMLEADEDGGRPAPATWSEIGESIVVVGGEGTWNCHIHTDLIGPSIEAAVVVGTPEQHPDHRSVRASRRRTGTRLERIPSHGPSGGLAHRRRQRCGRDGLVEVFRQLGVQGVVTGGQTMNPSTEDLLAAVEAAAADAIVVLPNNKNIVPVAEQLDALTTKTVAVVPTRSVAQGIAAMFGYDPAGDRLWTVLEDMAAAASSVITGEVTKAVRDAVVEFGSIRQGDWLGIADGTIVVADPDLEIGAQRAGRRAC